MSSVEIKKVVTKKDLKTFIEFHYDLYAGNAYDVPNLYIDDRNTLSKDKNALTSAKSVLSMKQTKKQTRFSARQKKLLTRL